MKKRRKRRPTSVRVIVSSPLNLVNNFGSATLNLSNSQIVNDSTAVMNNNSSFGTSGGALPVFNAGSNSKAVIDSSIQNNESNIRAIIVANSPNADIPNSGTLRDVLSENSEVDYDLTERSDTFPSAEYISAEQAGKQVVLGLPAGETALPVTSQQDSSINQLPGQLPTVREKRMKSIDTTQIGYGNDPCLGEPHQAKSDQGETGKIDHE